MILVSCPTCGNHMGELPEPTKVKQHLSPLEARAFDVLMSSGADGLNRIDLSIAIHGPEEGTEDNRLRQTASIISDVRRRIEPYGYHIQRLRTHGDNKAYRVVPVEVTP